MGLLRQAPGLAAAALLLCAAPGELRAEGRQIAILRFEGPKRVRARNQVIYRLKDHVDLVPPGAEGVDVTIDGVVSRRRRGFKLELTVRALGDGGEVKKIVLPLRPSGRFTHPGRRKVRKKLIPAIETLRLSEPEPGTGAVVEEPADPPRAPEAEAERDPEGEAEREPGAGAEPAPSPAPAPGGAPPERPRERTSPRGPVAARSLASFAFGPSLLRRDLGFDVDEAFANRPRPYRGFFPAGHAEGRVYPFGRGTTAFVRDLGLDFEVGMSPPFHSRVAGIGGPFVTRYTRWSAGARYRFRVGERLELQAGVGYGQRKFDLEPPDPAGDGRVPAEMPANVEYSAIRAGGGVRFRLGRWVPFLEGRYLLVRDGGEIEGGAMFGAASSSGFGGALGLEARFAGWMMFELSARYTRYRLDFLGTGERGDLDGDGGFDVSRAVDQYLGLALRAGVVL